MEGAQAFQRIGAGAPQLDVVTDDLLDADSFADGRDIAIGDPAGHRPSLGRRDASDQLAGPMTPHAMRSADMPAMPGMLLSPAPCSINAVLLPASRSSLVNASVVVTR